VSLKEASQWYLEGGKLVLELITARQVCSSSWVGPNSWRTHTHTHISTANSLSCTSFCVTNPAFESFHSVNVYTFNFCLIALIKWAYMYTQTHTNISVSTYSLHTAESFLRNQPLLSYSRNSQHFMETEGSLPHSQEPATCPFPEAARSSPCHHIPLNEDPA